MISQLRKEEFHPYYGTYIAKAEFPDIVEGLKAGKTEFIDFVSVLPDEKLAFAYAEGKWTVAEVLLHLIDSERIFAYRALRFARKDNTPLAGFDQDVYVPNSNAKHMTKNGIIEDYEAVRNSSITMYKNFTEEMLQFIGTASDSPMSARALGYILAGHQRHHLEVINEKYL